MKSAIAVTAAVVLTLCAATTVATAAERKQVYQAGDWQVMQSQDPMTDELSCTAIYKGEWKIQATRASFFVSLKGRGGLKAYTVRIDAAPADKLKIATDLEKRIGAAILTDEFPRIYDASRIKIQTMTALDTVILDDVSLKGFKASIDFMRQKGC